MTDTPSPGPWGTKQPFKDSTFIVDADGQTVVVVLTHQDVATDNADGSRTVRRVPIPHAEANINLLLAARDMLEALESVISTARLREQNADTPSGLFELLRDIEGTANAALAKTRTVNS